jgi:hypothetical protein
MQMSNVSQPINPFTGLAIERGRDHYINSGHGDDTHRNRRKLKRASKTKTLRSHRGGKAN